MMKKYDSMLTMSALNMAIISLHRIISSEDRVILDREYDNIINNLRMGEINADPELTELYQEIVRVISRGRLREDVRAKIRNESASKKKRTFKYFVNGNVLKNFSTSPVKWIGKVALSSASEYFNRLQTEEEMFSLKQEELNEYDELQRKLLASSWKLLRKYNLQDSYRITQNGLKNFSLAISEPDPSKRSRMLKHLESEFSAYAPYWFYRSEASRLSGDYDMAEKLFEKFCEVWRPVLRKDPYVAEAMKFRIEELIRSGGYENGGEILRCLALMKANAPLDDWANNILAGMVYFSLGCREEAEECVMCNIDFRFETEVSGKLLARMELDELPQRVNALPDNGKYKNLSVTDFVQSEETSEEEHETGEAKLSLKERAENGDPEAQYQLGASYIKRADKIELCFLILFFLVWIVLGYESFSYMMTDSILLNIFTLAVVIVFVFIGMALSLDPLSKYPEKFTSKYKGIARELYIKAAENGNTTAMYALGKWDTNEKNEDEALRWFKKAAECGHTEAQKLYDAMQKQRRQDT